MRRHETATDSSRPNRLMNPRCWRSGRCPTAWARWFASWESCAGPEGNANISALEYEVFQRMAEHQINLLFDEMAKRWPVESVRLVHRVGLVKVNEPSLWVEVVAPHRGEAFAACQWLIDEMKRVVPIWKNPVSGDR